MQTADADMTGNTLEQRAEFVATLERLRAEYPSDCYTEERAALRAGIEALRLSAGADWVLVPRDPTDEMIEAAWESEAVDYIGEHKRLNSAGHVWAAMLSAAPRHEPGEW